MKLFQRKQPSKQIPISNVGEDEHCPMMEYCPYPGSYCATCWVWRWFMKISNLKDDNNRKDRHIKELEDALRFYADKESWRIFVSQREVSSGFQIPLLLLEDRGEIARQALKEG